MSALSPLALTMGIFLIVIGLIAAVAGALNGGGHIGHLLALVGMVFALAGVLAEGALMQVMERRLGEIGEVYSQGEAGKFSWAAKGLSTAGAALLARRGRESRGAAVLGGALVCAGELCLRWAVFKAGFQSARDPKYVVESQRQRVAREGTKATTNPGDRPGPADRGA